MTQLVNPFDATKVDPTQGVGQFPVGKHPVWITDDEIKANAANDGGMLVLTLEILDGPSKGQQGPYRLNLYNKSEKAAEIAHKQLSAICHVTGVYQVTDARQLHRIPFTIEVGLQKDAEAAAKGYTEVKRVFDKNGNEPGKAGQPAAQAQPAQSTGGASAGWGGGAPAANAGGANAAGGWGGGNAANTQTAPAGGAPANAGWQQNAGGPGPSAQQPPAGDKPSWAR